MTETKPKPRSVSQYGQYFKCPAAYKLSRIDKVWRRPAAWLPQGTAAHAVFEEVERRELAGDPMTVDEAKDMFREEYAKDIGALTEVTPNFAWWFSSGPYRGKQDIERRYNVGLEQIEKFFLFRDQQEIWIAPDGTPGIEFRFDIELDGIPVIGFVDAVVVGPDGKPRIRDYKTGATPGDDFQLGAYSVALAKTYDIDRPLWGDYYMAGKAGKPGKPTKPYDLSEWTEERVTEEFRALEDALATGDFTPDPSPDKCRFCDVSFACPDSQA